MKNSIDYSAQVDLRWRLGTPRSGLSARSGKKRIIQLGFWIVYYMIFEDLCRIIGRAELFWVLLELPWLPLDMELGHFQGMRQLRLRQIVHSHAGQGLRVEKCV